MATDELIKQAVLEEMRRDERLSPGALAVTVQQQVVTLSGVADSYESKRAAEYAAYRVHPVKRVVNCIAVHQPGTVEHSDTEIAEAALVKLQGDRFIPADQVTLTVHQGWVTLQGEVEYDFQKADAEHDVNYLDGVLGVHNLLTVQPEPEVATPLDESKMQSQ